MFKKIQQLRIKYPFLKIIWNRYFLVVLFFIIWMLFLDNYSYLDHRLLNKEINELAREVAERKGLDFISYDQRQKLLEQGFSEEEIDN